MDYFEQMAAVAAAQGGYFYPWRSRFDGEDGEGFYTALVEATLGPDKTVLEAGCGHGPDVLAFAPKVARYIAYDAVAPFIETARASAAKAGLTNVELVLANSSPRFNGGVTRIPAADKSVDAIVSRRGPTNWIADAPRVCRPGARLIQINPLPGREAAWNAELPEPLRLAADPANPLNDELPGQIAAALDKAGLALERSWTFDVAETLDDPDELYKLLTFLKFEQPDMPSANEARPALAALLGRHGGALSKRTRRFVWTAVVD